jgi:hypothetical protein
MLRTGEIEIEFQSLYEFETFRIKWARACAKLNERGENAKNIRKAEERYRLMIKK